MLNPPVRCHLSSYRGVVNVVVKQFDLSVCLHAAFVHDLHLVVRSQRDDISGRPNYLVLNPAMMVRTPESQAALRDSCPLPSVDIFSYKTA